MSTLKTLSKYILIIDKHSEHFCKPENRGQLEWAMWRWVNLFYAARYMGKGYDDSISYFIDGHIEFTCTEKQQHKIKIASCAGNDLANWGYVNKNFVMRSYQLDVPEIINLQNGEVPEFAQLRMKKNKTWQDWLEINHHSKNPLKFGKKESDWDIERMHFTYYSGFKFLNGYLQSENDVEHDLDFPLKWKDVPSKIMAELNQILDDPKMVKMQNDAKKKWEKEVCNGFIATIGKHVEHLLEKGRTLKNIALEGWYDIHDVLMNREITDEDLEKSGIKVSKRPKDNYMDIHSGNVIVKIDKNCHQSYIDVAIRICNEILTNNNESTNNKDWAKQILKKLS